jgi:hypothetical protein
MAPGAARTEILTYPNFKGRSYRPQAFRFSFLKNIDRNRIFHCLRGGGVLDSVIGVTAINNTIFSLSVDHKENVAGDHQFKYFCDRNQLSVLISE